MAGEPTRDPRVLSRRSVLRGAGACLALPALESWLPRGRIEASPRRLAIFSVPFGMLPERFHPVSTGRDYAPSELLAPLAPLRGEFTVFSNLDHGMKGGHPANHTFLSGILQSQRAAFADKNITLDQRAAEVLGTATRFPSLVFWQEGLSFTKNGVRVPALRKPSDAFKLLFVGGSEDEMGSTRSSLSTGNSILDAVRSEAAAMQRVVSAADRAKLEEYLTAIRETEKRIQSEREWLERSKPKVDDPGLQGVAEGARDESYGASQVEMWFELMYLALASDSTRVVATNVDNCNWGLEGVKQTYHTLSHHRQREDYLEQLGIVEDYLMHQLARFLQRLQDTRQADGSTLLDTTQVLFGSGLGNGNRHTNDNLPIVLAGGGFRHGQHLDLGGKQPLCNLYLSMLRALGCPLESFNRSTGTLAGLEHPDLAGAPPAPR